MRPPHGPRGGQALDPSWAPEHALLRARESGVGALGDRHWKVITCCREDAARTGRVPALPRIETLTGFDAGELHALFPGDFEALIPLIAGLFRRSRASRSASDGEPKEN